MVANGLRVINSTNVYPNFELFETVLGEEIAALPENRTVYNRYCHVNINLGIYEEKPIYEVLISLGNEEYYFIIDAKTSDVLLQYSLK